MHLSKMTISADETTTVYVYVCIYVYICMYMCICIYINETIIADCTIRDNT